MGLSASQARLLFLTGRLSDLELRAQKVSNAKIRLAQESEQASEDYAKALDKKIFKVQRGSDGAFEVANLNNLTDYNTKLDFNSTHGKYRLITDGSGKIVMSRSDYDKLKNDYNGDRNNYFEKMGVPKKADGNYNEDSDAFKYYSQIWAASVNTNADGSVNVSSHPSINIIENSQADNAEWLERQVSIGSLNLDEWKPDGGKDGKGTFEDVSWTSGDTTVQEVEDKTGIAKAEAKYEATMADINTKDKKFDLELKNIDTEHQATQTTIDSVKKVIDKNIERNMKMFQA